MVVVEAAERATDHRIAKMLRPLVASDAAGHPLPNTEVLRSPRNLLARPEQARGHASNRSFASVSRGSHMKVDAPREVEDPFHRCTNERGQLNDRHESYRQCDRLREARMPNIASNMLLIITRSVVTAQVTQASHPRFVESRLCFFVKMFGCTKSLLLSKLGPRVDAWLTTWKLRGGKKENASAASRTKPNRPSATSSMTFRLIVADSMGRMSASLCPLDRPNHP
jgi:hypothetical protein